MVEQKTHSTSAPAFEIAEEGSIKQALMSPLLWGGLATFGFYQLIPLLPMHRELAQRYFCGHPLEYVQTAMFFVGMALLASRMIGLRRERSALAECRLATPQSLEEGEIDACSELDSAVSRLPARLHNTQIARRLRDLSAYLRHRQSAGGVEEQMRYLDQAAADRVYESYSLLQTINWAVPIIGFLGTVMGITLAIANLNVDSGQLDDSLNHVTVALAVAFDTTALALSYSIVLVFGYFFVKKAEGGVLTEVEEFGQRCVLPLIPQAHSAGSPLLEAETEAAQKLIDRTESLIEGQTRMWQESVESLRTRWTGTLEDQQARLAGALTKGTRQTLSDHAAQLAELRQQLAGTLGEIATELSRQMERSSRVRHEQDESLTRRMETFADDLSRSLASAQASADERNEAMIAAMTEQITGWQQQLQHATNAVEAQLAGLTAQTQALTDLVEQEGGIAALQSRLTDNLEALRTAETFEQTMHSLSAAVHMLTVHARPKAA
ncbi:MAG: hypothetical protein DWQ34_25040 [Planctomycetota bacterium]|nr:MAG: hypothetical protein DWQ34_25040 [Planctomycetota bacterium]REK24454.1 MAG: hypothetical protein DWQ41_15680 [Planctomycetota bacterium]REK38643.1 MAG: hypothetical protein DWQ45_04465 [Planctomycetota bacterium]